MDYKLILCWILIFIIIPIVTLIKYSFNSEKIIITYFLLFVKKRINYSELEEIIIGEYKPINDVNGWYLKGNDKVLTFNHSGKRGILLVFKDKTKKNILIGTRKDFDYIYDSILPVCIEYNIHLSKTDLLFK